MYERELAVEQDLEPVAASARPRRRAGRVGERRLGGRPGDAVAPRPCHFWNAMTAKRVCSPSRPSTASAGGRRDRRAAAGGRGRSPSASGRRGRRRTRRRHVRSPSVGGGDRRAGHDAREEPERRRTLAEQPDRPHAAHGGGREDELGHASGPTRRLRPGGELLAQVDRGDSIGDGDGPERCPGRHGGRDLAASLRSGRPGQERGDRLAQRRAVARHRDELLALEEGDAHGRERGGRGRCVRSGDERAVATARSAR